MSLFYISLGAVGAGVLIVGIKVRRSLYRVKVPESFEGDADFKDFLVAVKKIKFLSKVGSWLGLGHRVHLLRRLFDYFLAVPEPPGEDPDLKVTSEKFDGIDVKFYMPTAEHDGLRAGMLYIHGGGWVWGSADEMDGVTRGLAKQANMIVASVDYRMAPEHLYPACIDDCMQAMRYFLSNAEKFGVNKDRVCVAGDSAGGNLAAAVALKLRDEKFTPALKYQVLIYPALQAFDFNTISYVENEDDPYINRGLAVSCWLWYAFGHDKYFNYLVNNDHTSPEAKERFSTCISRDLLPNHILESAPNPPKTSKGNKAIWDKIEKVFSDPYFAPLMCKSLSGLPDTYLMTCEQDVLRDEGLMYKRRLEEAKVKVTHEHYNALHGLLDTLHMELAQVALDRMGEHLKQQM